MRKTNEVSLLQTEIWTLESELRELDMLHEDRTPTEETSRHKPKRHLPSIPRGRADHFEYESLLELNLYDDSSVEGTYTPLPAAQLLTRSIRDTGNKPATSTPSVPQTKIQGSSGVEMKPATFDGTGSWKDYRAHFDAVAEINDWNQPEKGLYLAVA